jgi:hypothetical protein
VPLTPMRPLPPRWARPQGLGMCSMSMSGQSHSVSGKEARLLSRDMTLASTSAVSGNEPASVEESFSWNSDISAGDVK